MPKKVISILKLQDDIFSPSLPSQALKIEAKDK